MVEVKLFGVAQATRVHGFAFLITIESRRFAAPKGSAKSSMRLARANRDGQQRSQHSRPCSSRCARMIRPQ